MLTVDKKRLLDIEQSARLEWVITNGLGGYASSTVTGMNTRRYHGLLVSALKPPVDRFVTLAALEEEVKQGDNEWFLSTAHYGRVIHPRGFQYLESFDMNPFPVSTFQLGKNTIKKTVFLIHGENTVLISYSFTSGEAPIDLQIYPLITFRDYHSLKRITDAEVSSIHVNRGLKLHFGESDQVLSMVSDAADFYEKDTVYRDIHLLAEAERGFDHCEDYHVPGRFRITLRPGQSFSILASTDVMTFRDTPARLFLAEVDRTNKILNSAPKKDEFTARLTLAADTFMIRRQQGERSIIAGYHWFTDWSRDAMISLPGLTLCLGKHREALDILNGFAHHLKGGLLPNRFPDHARDPIEYNAIDSPLWFIHAVFQYFQYSADRSGLRKGLLDSVCQILDAYIEGTDYGIHMDGDFLITGGDPNSNLTWMDAVSGLYPVTPRYGKAVEINALFYSALEICENLLESFGKSAGKYSALAVEVKKSFRQQFIREDKLGLYDLIQQSRKCNLIRPNQIFAISLPFSPLTRSEGLQVLQLVGRELLTPYGLRSLAPKMEGYIGKYQGSPPERDNAYHQGTVWSWLMGPYITAMLRCHEYSARSLENAATLLEPFKKHMLEAGIGTISEIFDGEKPHNPRGTVSQAWSVAELLRVLVEDIEGKQRKAPLA